MFRARIGLAAAAVVAAISAAAVTQVSAKLGDATKNQVESQVEHAQAAFPKLDLLRGIELTNETAKLAREDEFGEIFAKSGDDQRQAAFVAVQARNARLEAQGRKADLVAVVGANGRVVSRDLNINAMYDDDVKAKYPSVVKALDGVSNKDLWSFNGHLYRVGAAPIRSKAGVLVGALIVGYVASASDAQSDKDKLGTEVAYFLDRKVQASSFRKSAGESPEEKALAALLFDGPKHANGTLAGERTKLFTVSLRGEDYVAAAGPLPGNMTRSASGYVVLSSLTAARAPIESVRWWVLGLGLCALIAAVGAAVMTAMRFLMPLDAIERGVAEVINGNRDYQFEAPSPDFEGLANGLNVLMARLLGRPDPTDDELGGLESEQQQRWQGELTVDEVSNAGPQTSPENLALAEEPEPEYLARIFKEYAEACKQTGENPGNYEGFIDKLRKSEASLKGKYNARLVRFKVQVKGSQVTLKPVPIA